MESLLNIALLTSACFRETPLTYLLNFSARSVIESPLPPTVFLSFSMKVLSMTSLMRSYEKKS